MLLRILLLSESVRLKIKRALGDNSVANGKNSCS